MSKELKSDPFDEEGEFEKEDLISDGMVKKATYLIHKLAGQKGKDFKEIQKECKKLFAYTNLAKVSLTEGHAIIDKLNELTGGEEQQGARVTDDGSPHLPTKPDDNPTAKKDEIIQDESKKIEGIESEIGDLAEMLQICVGYARDIVTAEMGKENITEGTRAMLVKSFAATLFIDASKRGIGR